MRVLAREAGAWVAGSSASCVMVFGEHIWLYLVGPELEGQGAKQRGKLTVVNSAEFGLTAAGVVGQSSNCHIWSGHCPVCIVSLSRLLFIPSIILPTWLDFPTCLSPSSLSFHFSSLSLNPSSASRVVFHPGSQKPQ